MALTVLVVSLASNFIKPPVVVPPPVPIEVFKLCAFGTDYQFKMVPHSLSTAFGA